MLKKIILPSLLLVIIFSFAAAAQTVYITESGSKFHTEECRYAKNGKAISLVKAVEDYEPCKLCKAAELIDQSAIKKGDSQKSGDKNKGIKKSKTEKKQCHGITKKGTRCKRNAEDGRDFC